MNFRSLTRSCILTVVTGSVRSCLQRVNSGAAAESCFVAACCVDGDCVRRRTQWRRSNENASQPLVNGSNCRKEETSRGHRQLYGQIAPGCCKFWLVAPQFSPVCFSPLGESCRACSDTGAMPMSCWSARGRVTQLHKTQTQPFNNTQLNYNSQSCVYPLSPSPRVQQALQLVMVLTVCL